MPATNDQVQAFVNERIRPRCEQIRALYLAIKDDIAAIDDVYANLNASNPPSDWADNNTSNPPHMLTPSDVLAIHTFNVMFAAFVEAGLTDQNKNSGGDQYPKVLDGCVRPVQL